VSVCNLVRTLYCECVAYSVVDTQKQYDSVNVDGVSTIMSRSTTSQVSTRDDGNTGFLQRPGKLLGFQKTEKSWNCVGKKIVESLRKFGICISRNVPLIDAYKKSTSACGFMYFMPVASNGQLCY